MDTYELRQRQANFEGKRQSNKVRYKKLNTLSKAFIKAFPPSSIAGLTIEEYVEGKLISGKPNTDTFCYWVEWETEELGSMRGARADKFGLYFDKSINDYKYTRKYSSPNDTLGRLKDEILKLIEFGGNEDIEDIKKVELSPMFKAKILFLYYPDRFINIFAESWVDYFLNAIGVGATDLDIHLIDKRELLYKFKINDKIMRNWKMWEFSDFLYFEFGKPPNKDQTPEGLKPYIDYGEDYPKIKDVSPEYIELTIIKENKKGRGGKASQRKMVVDFEEENRRFARLGERGEIVVLMQERKYLLELGKDNLARKVKQVSKKNVSAGYDILSFEPDGRKKYIEVKATSRSYKGIVSFLISSNELEKAKELENYYIYIVFNTKLKNPKIWPLKDASKLFYSSITLKPINYRAEISVGSKNCNS